MLISGGGKLLDAEQRAAFNLRDLNLMKER